MSQALSIEREDYSPAPVPRPSLFRSFWHAGFESACHVNSKGVRLDMTAVTQHDRFVKDDYALVESAGIQVVRETARWHLIERPGGYDFSSLLPMVRAAEMTGLESIWNLCHYGWPDDLDIFSPRFIDHFAKFARATARLLRDESAGTLFFAPINEISFFTFATTRFMYPYAKGRDFEMKRQLVRAGIAATEAIWDVDPQARIIWADPIINVVAPLDKPWLAAQAEAATASQFEAWDMIAGRVQPELGGDPKYLDIIGGNFYHNNQWEVDTGEKIHWHIRPFDERWVPFRHLVARLYRRYERPVYVAETSHIGVGRAQWVRELSDEILAAREDGVPVEGVCLFPIIDRPDWEDFSHWHNSGLWDLHCDAGGCLLRVIHDEYAEEIQRMRCLLAEHGCC
jgi:beta-glucosidase/6-phospho-beta-glucosidase/beta-galactosidase